jgi:hypothetical protein
LPIEKPHTVALILAEISVDRSWNYKAFLFVKNERSEKRLIGPANEGRAQDVFLVGISMNGDLAVR